MAFDIDESRQKFVLAEAGKLARNYRSYLSRLWVEDDDGNINSSPPEQYRISQEDWTKFVEVRQSEAFQVIILIYGCILIYLKLYTLY